ncbi:MAG TPA: zinc ribbon domain-containing protein, partial [Tepidisphaeraceae bacterium]
MAAGTFTCPRCLRSAPITAGMKFCPHCGLPDAHLASQGGPIDVKVNDRPFRVHDRLAVGSISTIYRCGFWDQGRQIEGVFKIARDARTNPLVDNEAKILRHLHAADDTRRFGPFLPQVVENFDFAGGGAGSDVRRANVLQMDPDIHSPDELYTLGEVRAAYPAGLDGRDVAWIWRRLLNILGFVHEQHIVHGAVLPMHV